MDLRLALLLFCTLFCNIDVATAAFTIRCNEQNKMVSLGQPFLLSCASQLTLDYCYIERNGDSCWFGSGGSAKACGFSSRLTIVTIADGNCTIAVDNFAGAADAGQWQMKLQDYNIIGSSEVTGDFDLSEKEIETTTATTMAPTTASSAKEPPPFNIPVDRGELLVTHCNLERFTESQVRTHSGVAFPARTSAGSVYQDH